ncbi:flagellar hook-basal body complex protein FliE [Rhodobacteraceae bacterium XHP0102]|nr:flagellar hook-basal body complex protein FliE [Rhodobacteraceae bacterium XHP0102]
MELKSSYAAAAYSRPSAPNDTGGPIGRPSTRSIHTPNANDAFETALRNFGATLENSETLARNAMTTGADPHSLVMALAQTELAVETAVTVRNRVVEAYQEILRMPV